MTNWNARAHTHWHPIALAHRVGNKPLAVTVLDRPLVLARDGEGKVFVLEDRCPHRQAPLSQGRMTEAGLECPYHGWTFGANGRCSKMPGLAPEDAMPDVGARSHQVVELDGMVWVRLAAVGEAAPPALITGLAPGSQRFLWQTRWQAHVIDALENFLDPLHTHLIHPGLVRRDNARERMTASIEETAEGFVVEYSGQVQQSGILYRLFESPRLSERVYFAGAGSAQIEYRYRNNSIIRITLHFTPQTAEYTHVFATLHVENRWAPKWAVRLFVWPLLRQVAAQDARMLALQADNMQRFPGSRPVSTKLDLVRPYLEKFWKPDALAVPASQVVQLYL